MESDSGSSAPAEAAERLRQSALLQRTLTANLPDTSVFLFDRDLRILIAEGEGVRRLPWIDAELFRGRTVGELQGELPSDILAMSLDCYRGALDGERRAFEFSSDGLTFDVTAVPVRGPDGEVESALAVVRDVTERRAVEADRARLAAIVASSAIEDAERVARKSDALLHAVLEHAPMTVTLRDLEGRYVVINRWGAAAVGTTSEELLRRQGEVFEPPQIVEEHERAVRAGEGAATFEVTVPDISGCQRTHLTTKFPVTDFEGRVVAVGGISVDITERKRIDEALRASEERFRLQAEELTDRTVALEAVNQELESFSYSVSHDLRAPLRAIDGFTATLERDYADKLDDNGQNLFARVRRATAKMSTLIEGLLALSRLSRCQLTRTRLDISALASEIEQELRESDPGRVVEFVIEDGLSALADGGLTRAALTNLLGNAWKFSAQREDGRIEFASAGGRSFVVRDNGLGFDMTYVDKLFVPFERLHRDDEVAGTGVGLATVKRIVNRHGGQLRGEGTVGEGAAFYFDFGDATLPS